MDEYVERSVTIMYAYTNTYLDTVRAGRTEEEEEEWEARRRPIELLSRIEWPQMRTLQFARRVPC